LPSDLKLTVKGRGLVHMTCFKFLGAPKYLGNGTVKLCISYLVYTVRT